MRNLHLDNWLPSISLCSRTVSLSHPGTLAQESGSRQEREQAVKPLPRPGQAGAPCAVAQGLHAKKQIPHALPIVPRNFPNGVHEQNVWIDQFFTCKTGKWTCVYHPCQLQESALRSPGHADLPCRSRSPSVL